MTGRRFSSSPVLGFARGMLSPSSIFLISLSIFLLDRIPFSGSVVVVVSMVVDVVSGTEVGVDSVVDVDVSVVEDVSDAVVAVSMDVVVSVEVISTDVVVDSAEIRVVSVGSMVSVVGVVCVVVTPASVVVGSSIVVAVNSASDRFEVSLSAAT